MTAAGAVLLAAAATAVCGEPGVTRIEECERLLRSADVVSSRKLSEGITGSLRVELRDGGTVVRAVFKTVDTKLDAKETVGSETVKSWRDSWKHEVAAYELDKLLGMRLVPTVVEREIEGKRGSLQLWIERPLARFGVGPAPPEPRRADGAVHAARLLDYLIYNRDRHVRNLLFGGDYRPIAIDNSITFQAFVLPYRPLYRFPRVAVERLAQLERGSFRKALGRYLAGEEMDGLLRRVDRLRTIIQAVRAESGDEAALFDW
jgi:hypothetical protein